MALFLVKSSKLTHLHTWKYIMAPSVMALNVQKKKERSDTYPNFQSSPKKKTKIQVQCEKITKA